MISRFTLGAIVAAGLVGSGWNAAAAGPPFELTVEKDQSFGSSKGTLVIDVQGIEFRATDKDDTRKWSYIDIRQVQILTPTRIDVLTYEDQGGLKMGADRTVQFKVVGGKVPPELIVFLHNQIRRPMMTAVMPPSASEPPLYRVPVKYERHYHGSNGMLLLHDASLAYVSQTERDGRYWRMTDIFAVLQLDPYRLEVLAYEGGGGDLRRFTFQIKTELPDGFYQALWVRVNPPTLDLRNAAKAQVR